ncbi:MAG: US12 family protein [Clostridia bacterium]|nr:US12 family protein [Clostridia bacterium]
MINSKNRKLERLNSGLSDTLSENVYNLVIGGCLIYGFIVNAIMITLFGDFFLYMNPVIFIISYVVLAFTGILVSSISKNPIVSFIGYNMVVVPIGALLAICLPGYPAKEILLAVIITGAVVGVMTVMATTRPKIFENLGLTLGIALILGILGETIALLFGYAGNAFNWLFVIIFSLYIGYDWHKAQVYPKTLDNAVDSAIDLYLDIINLFIRLLSIINRSRD